MPGTHFAAIALPDALRSHLHGVAESTAKMCPGFRPMAQDALHCTAMFYGSLLIDAAVSTTQEVHACLGAASNATLGRVDVVKLDLFPPHKQNLLVAVLRVPPEWHEHRNDLGHPAVTQLNPTPWMPHVTLGKYATGAKSAAAPKPPPMQPFGLDAPFKVVLLGPPLSGRRAAPS